MKNLATIRKVIVGALIGTAFLMPGFSGGTIAASLGYYEPVIASISGMGKHPRASLAYLLPLAMGCICGIALFAWLVLRLVTDAETQALSLFLGLVAGSVPALYKEANPGKFRPGNLLLMLIGTLATASLLFLKPAGGADAAVAVTTPIAFWSGAILGAGTAIPGISSALFLIHLRWYKPVMGALVALNARIILITMGGFVALVLVFIKLMDWLFTRYRSQALCVILGFAIGSTALVYPADFFLSNRWLNILLALLGMGVGFALGRIPKVETETYTS